MTKHTPGPWVATWTTRERRGQEKGWHVYSKEEEHGEVDGTICELRDDNLVFGDQEANARLIAASPELLKQLKYLVSFVEASGITMDPRNWTLADPKAAIKAATGEE